MTTVAVLLSGCGVQDGAEVHESVLLLLALERAGCRVRFLAPDVEQMHVIDHHTGEVMEGEKRNVRVEAARIARGPVDDVAEANIDDFDAVAMPGGFGAAKSLCDFAVKGHECTVEPGTKRFLEAALDAKKPIAAACIAPALLAAVLRDRKESAELTIGTNAEVAAKLEKMGVVHTDCSVEQAHSDPSRSIVSCPAYMLAGSVTEAAASIDAMVARLMEVLGATARA